MSRPKIILWDIECSWGGVRDAANSVAHCIAWKEYGKSKVHCQAQWDYDSWERDLFDDKQLIKDVYAVLSEADAYVFHYGKRFDLPFFNTRAMIHGLPPLPKVPLVDTWRVAKDHLKLFNNRMNTVAGGFGLESKTHVGRQLWNDVLNRKKSACKSMVDYCKQDIIVLEDVFTKVKPFTNAVNWNLWKDKPGCHNCDSGRTQWRGYARSKAKTYRRYQCKDCGSWGKELATGNRPL